MSKIKGVIATGNNLQLKTQTFKNDKAR